MCSLILIKGCVFWFLCACSAVFEFVPWSHITCILKPPDWFKLQNWQPIFFELALIIFWVIIPSIWYIFLCMCLGRMKQLSKLDNKERLPRVPTALWISASHFSREAIQYQLNRCLFKGDNPSEFFSWISYELD